MGGHKGGFLREEGERERERSISLSCNDMARRRHMQPWKSSHWNLTMLAPCYHYFINFTNFGN